MNLLTGTNAYFKLFLSTRELAKNMIDRLPEDKMIYVLNILENIAKMLDVDTVSARQEDLDQNA